MILLLGIPSEPPLRLLAEACAAKGIACTWFNQRGQERWSVTTDHYEPGSSVLSNGEQSFRLDDCQGLYLRTMDHTCVPEYAGSGDKKAIDTMYARLFRLMDAETMCRITNPPSAQMSNNSKPYQSLMIRRYGLDIPAMCITSDEDEARAFFRQHKKVIYKSISGARSIVKQLDDTAIQQLHKIKYCPVQFQECVTGSNVRVHVIGEQVMATRICSDAVDYRYAQAEGKIARLEATELPAGIAEKCVALAHGLQLPFAGIDLMMTGDGRTICFEVNPSPGYSYYEQHTGQQISHALAEYLSARR